MFWKRMRRFCHSFPTTYWYHLSLLSPSLMYCKCHSFILLKFDPLASLHAYLGKVQAGQKEWKIDVESESWSSVCCCCCSGTATAQSQQVVFETHSHTCERELNRSYPILATNKESSYYFNAQHTIFSRYTHIHTQISHSSPRSLFRSRSRTHTNTQTQKRQHMESGTNAGHQIEVTQVFGAPATHFRPAWPE